MIKTFNTKDLQVIFGGIIVGGYAPGTVIKVDMNADLYNVQVGADGEGARARTNDNSATIEITLLQTSATNLAFSEITEIDRRTGGGVQPMLIRDAGGATVYSTSCAFVKKLPSAEFGQDITNRVWQLYTADMQVAIVGGN